MNFEDSAEWRRQTAKENPRDSRNLQAATILDRLAETVSSIDDATFDAYHELFEGFTENAHHSMLLDSIGFSWRPRTATEFVQRFISEMTGLR